MTPLDNSTLGKFFNWAADNHDLISLSPCKGIKTPAEESSRARALNDEEIRLVWGAFERAGRPFGPLAQLLLLTGARRDEVASARWNEIDFAARILTLPKEGTKSGVAHEIPLSDAVVEIIEGLPRVEGKGGFVFTTTGKTAVSGFCKAKAKVDAAILKAIRQEAEARGGGPAVEALPHWTLYDLLRTVATNLQKLGVRLEVT